MLPLRFFRLFLDTLIAEVGRDTLTLVLEKADLSPELVNPQLVSTLTSQTAAETFASIQHAVRRYYGRGARGTLTRIGRLLWPRLLENASLPEKAQAQMVRTLPPSIRVKPAVELLARFLRERPAGVTIHTLDLDLMLVDHAGAATLEQKESTPMCFVTLGLIQEVLFWAMGREYDIEEVSCRANGGATCEFKINTAQK